MEIMVVVLVSKLSNGQMFGQLSLQLSLVLGNVQFFHCSSLQYIQMISVLCVISELECNRYVIL